MGWTIETRCLFLRFSIVLPKTLLFMSLKKSFSKSFFALARRAVFISRSEEHTSELQSLRHLVCRLLLEKKNTSHSSFHIMLSNTNTHQSTTNHDSEIQ